MKGATMTDEKLLVGTPRRRFWRPRPLRSARGQQPKGRTARVPHPKPGEALLPLPPSDIVHLADLLAPGSLQEFRDAVCVGGGINGAGEEWVHGIAVTAFPRE